MAVGIRLSDAVHTVSPGYKVEIQQPTIPRRFDPHAERFGGEGLEADLVQADREGRLHGILNGCEYDNRSLPRRDAESFQKLVRQLTDTVSSWRGKTPRPAHDLALRRLQAQQHSARRPSAVLTCVTRAVNQKIRLMLTPDDRPALGQILERLADDALMVLLGAGELEGALFDLSARYDNFVFLNAFDNACANALYAQGDLFLMPSSFEPCGISQMLAMRDGQPCVAHHVGGLKDTIRDNETGFAFTGGNSHEQAQNFVACTLAAVRLLQTKPQRYDEICQAAFEVRYLWSDSVKKYVRLLYR
jgi:starch synthase